MRARVELWVRLKVTDLVAQTALMTLTEKLGFEGTLCGLVHYWYWALTAEGPDPSSILVDLDRVVRLDSAFTNQNKHLYRLGIVGGSGGPVFGDLDLERDRASARLHCSGHEGRLWTVDCLVRELRTEREAGYGSRLGSRLEGTAVRDMRAGEIWRLFVHAAAESEARGLAEAMAVSRSRREGLLLNPHYQSFEIVGCGAGPEGE